MSASWLGVKLGLAESIQAFRAIDAEIELQPILNFLASRDLREAGSVNIPPQNGKRPDNLKTNIAPGPVAPKELHVTALTQTSERTSSLSIDSLPAEVWPHAHGLLKNYYPRG